MTLESACIHAMRMRLSHEWLDRANNCIYIPAHQQIPVYISKHGSLC